MLRLPEATAPRSLDSIVVRIRARFRGRARSASSVAFAAFAVHQLRYLLASGRSEDGLGRLGHAYLGHLPPLLIGLGLAAVVAGLAGRATAEPRPPRRAAAGALLFALGIVAVFCAQELIEGALVAGHAGGLAAIFSSGGWAALPLAALFGLLAALVDRGIEGVEARLGTPSASLAAVVPAIRTRAVEAFLGRRLSPLALGLARRPPPALS